MFSPRVSFPFTCVAESTTARTASNCSATRCDPARLELRPRRPSVHQLAQRRPGRRTCRSLVVEAVRHLVPDHRADRPVVHRVVRRPRSN